MTDLIAFLTGDQMVLVLAALWAVSEFLGSIESVAANGVFTAIRDGLEWVMGFFPGGDSKK